MDAKTYELIALTDIWTGDVDGKADRLITTGLLGSIRWWFEVVVRGLGGLACDPSAKNKTCQDDKHCVVCELFGCTGWARKFRFDVIYDRKEIKSARNERKFPFGFELQFTPFRPICDQEWELLDLTLRLIAKYGALGGKTVYKPTEEDHRQTELHHQDFGLVKLIHRPTVSKFSKDELQAYIGRWLDAGSKGSPWASLEHFWFVEGRTLARTSNSSSAFNRVLGRHESKECCDCGAVHDPPRKCDKTRRHPRRHSEQLANREDRLGCWLAGGRGESKKVFSFRDPARTFGFVKPETITHNGMKQRLRKAWPHLKDNEYQVGVDILDKLCADPEAPS